MATNERGLPIVFTGKNASQKANTLRKAVTAARDKAIAKQLDELVLAKAKKARLKKLSPRQRKISQLRFKREEAQLRRAKRRDALKKKIRLKVKKKVVAPAKRVGRKAKRKVKKKFEPAVRRVKRKLKRKKKPKTKKQLEREAKKKKREQRKEFRRVKKLLAKRERALPKKIRKERRRRLARRVEEAERIQAKKRRGIRKKREFPTTAEQRAESKRIKAQQKTIRQLQKEIDRRPPERRAPLQAELNRIRKQLAPKRVVKEGIKPPLKKRKEFPITKARRAESKRVRQRERLKAEQARVTETKRRID